MSMSGHSLFADLGNILGVLAAHGTKNVRLSRDASAMVQKRPSSERLTRSIRNYGALPGEGLSEKRASLLPGVEVCEVQTRRPGTMHAKTCCAYQQSRGLQNLAASGCEEGKRRRDSISHKSSYRSFFFVL